MGGGEGEINWLFWGGCEILGLFCKKGLYQFGIKAVGLGMAAKKMEGRTDLMEEKMAEVQGELHKEMGSVCGELQRLGPLEKNLGVLIEKIGILDRVDLAL